jgi:hypothetical protein
MTDQDGFAMKVFLLLLALTLGCMAFGKPIHAISFAILLHALSASVDRERYR